MGEVAKVGSICKFCRHLCDNTQRNQLLVCGMHSYGPAGDDDCEDFEPLAPGAPSTSRMLPHQSPTHVVTSRIMGTDDRPCVMMQVSHMSLLLAEDRFYFEDGNYAFATCDRDRLIAINGQEVMLRADTRQRMAVLVRPQPTVRLFESDPEIIFDVRYRAHALRPLPGDAGDRPAHVNCRCAPVPESMGRVTRTVREDGEIVSQETYPLPDRPWLDTDTPHARSRFRAMLDLLRSLT